MANDCMFMLRAVAESKKSLERLIKIMQYDDGQYHLYRVRSLYVTDDPSAKGSLFECNLEGDVAWSCDPWLPIGGDLSDDAIARMDLREQGSTCVLLSRICKELMIGLECWAMEPLQGFQQHFAIDSTGCLILNDSIDWKPVDIDYDDKNIVGESFFIGTPEELYHPKEGGYRNFGESTVPDIELVK